MNFVAQRIPLYLDLIRWNRPAGWLLLLWPSLGALWIAAGGFPGWHLLVVFTLGTILMRSAGCCINDVADREFDRHVKRTAQRPVLTTNSVTVAWSFAALAVTLMYPYAKRFVSMPQAVLGVAFSFGIPMAFAAVQATVPVQAWVLLVGNLFWVLAYDTEYAMVDRDDDLRIGMKTSAITLGRWDVPAVLAFYVVYLAIWSWVMAPLVHSSGWWLGVAAAAAQVVWHGTLIRTRTREGCFKAFRVNHWVGLALFVGVVLTY
jgi:4-hydroxybenzoate polyprenyltransferase